MTNIPAFSFKVSIDGIKPEFYFTGKEFKQLGGGRERERISRALDVDIPEI